MKCKEIISKLSFLPKGELTYQERRVTLSHLNSCSNCNEIYQQYLRMFYLIDSKTESSVPTEILKDFSSEIMEKVDNTTHSKNYIWYIAAAILIFVLVFYPHNPENNFKNTGTVSITELIEKEDWESVLILFSQNDIHEELVSVNFLISKINEIDIGLANHKLNESLGSKSMDLNNILNMLKNYQHFSNQISTIEILNYLKKNKGVIS